MPKFYLRTNLGEFVKNCTEEDVLSYIKDDQPMEVETLSGWACTIRSGDIKIWGEYKTFEKIAEKQKEANETIPQSFTQMRFIHKPDKSEVVIRLINEHNEETIDIGFDAQVFVEKIIEELPNGIKDAIIEEQERRDFS